MSGSWRWLREAVAGRSSLLSGALIGVRVSEPSASCLDTLQALLHGIPLSTRAVDVYATGSVWTITHATGRVIASEAPTTVGRQPPSAGCQTNGPLPAVTVGATLPPVDVQLDLRRRSVASTDTAWCRQDAALVREMCGG